MHPPTNLPSLVEDLEVNIDELTTTLAPLLSPLSKTASSLPLLDKSKLYVLAAYSIESLLFSTLQASGINAKQHAIFPELARLKGYFAKIKEIEDRGVRGSAEGRARLDVGAARRFIKHGLSGNERHDLERRENMAKEKARAAIKARQINKKFDDEGNAVDHQHVTPKKRGVEHVVSAEESAADEARRAGLESSATEPHASKKPRLSPADLMDVDDEAQSASRHSSTSPPRKDSPRKQLGEQSTRQTDAITSHFPPSIPATSTPIPEPKKRRSRATKSAIHDAPPAQTPQDATNADTPAPSTRKSRRHNSRPFDADRSEEVILPPAEAPKTRSAAFTALLSGELPRGKVGKGKDKAKGRRN